MPTDTGRKPLLRRIMLWGLSDDKLRRRGRFYGWVALAASLGVLAVSLVGSVVLHGEARELDTISVQAMNQLKAIPLSDEHDRNAVAFALFMLNGLATDLSKWTYILGGVSTYIAVLLFGIAEFYFKCHELLNRTENTSPHSTRSGEA